MLKIEKHKKFRISEILIFRKRQGVVIYEILENSEITETSGSLFNFTRT